MNTKPLKPCPFCGKIPEITLSPGSYGYYAASLSINCCHGLSIGAAVEEYDWDKREHVDTTEKARSYIIEKWNTRVTSGVPS